MFFKHLAMLLVGSVATAQGPPVAIANSSVVGQTGNMQTAVVAQRVQMSKY
jgi:hypothetical protein